MPCKKKNSVNLLQKKTLQWNKCILKLQWIYVKVCTNNHISLKRLCENFCKKQVFKIHLLAFTKHKVGYLYSLCSQRRPLSSCTYGCSHVHTDAVICGMQTSIASGSGLACATQGIDSSIQVILKRVSTWSLVIVFAGCLLLQ